MTDRMDDSIEEVGEAMAGLADMSASLSDGLREARAAMDEASAGTHALSRGLSSGMRRAFEGVVFDGMKLSDALQGIARSAINSVYSAAMRPVTNGLASSLGGLLGGAFASGAPISQGRVMPFAKGGVVSGATTFPMRGGLGLMGEAGPEAIMPLARGPDGSLGVRAEGRSRPVTVVMNITTPDAQSFQKSRSQIAAQMTRALGSGRRNG